VDNDLPEHRHDRRWWVVRGGGPGGQAFDDLERLQLAEPACITIDHRVEPESVGHDALGEPGARLLGAGKDVRGNEFHRPTVAQRRRLPLFWGQAVERPDQGRPLGMDHLPRLGVARHRSS